MARNCGEVDSTSGIRYEALRQLAMCSVVEHRIRISVNLNCEITKFTERLFQSSASSLSAAADFNGSAKRSNI